MSDNLTVQVSTLIRCEEVVVAMLRFLAADPLPPILTDDKLLVNLMAACENARERLAEERRG